MPSPAVFRLGQIAVLRYKEGLAAILSAGLVADMDARAKISVVLRNNNSTLSMNQIEVYDNVFDAPAGVFTLKGGESRSITIGQGSDGKGSVRIRNLDVGPDEWAEIDSISPGDVIAV